MVCSLTKNSQDSVYLLTTPSGWIEEPIATFGLTEDYNVKATCLTWVNINRVALGHSDGSITLWSIHPRQLLQRVGAHTTYILDICSGFPSQPYLVTTVPIGGCVTLTDLSQPSGEMTYFPSPAISHQPNLLCWSEVMQGFMALYPTSTPNTTIAFLHHRFFCQARPITTGPNYLMSASAGATHPFLLVGCADGSVFSCNALQKLFKQKGEPMCKLRVFEHEYRPVEGDAEVRGAVRILQGFLPEENDDPRTEKRKESNRKKKKAEKKKKKKRGRQKKGAVEADAADGARDSEAEADEAQISRAIIHEPLTRVTSIQWNPNLPFSCWAACAMASGLIKVMDLGVVDETA
jgi:transcription factor C subunit 6